MLLVVFALGWLTHARAGLRVLDVGRIETNDLVFALACASGAVPILEFTAFGLFLAEALASGVAGPLLEFVFAFADAVAVATAGFGVIVSSKVL